MQRIAYLHAAHPERMIGFARELSRRPGWWLLASGESYRALQAAGLQASNAEALFQKTQLDPSVFILADVLGLCLRAPTTHQATTALAGYGLVGIHLLYCDPYRDLSLANQMMPNVGRDEADNNVLALLLAAVQGAKYVLTDAEQGERFVQYLDAGEPNAARVALMLGRAARWVAAHMSVAAARLHGPADGAGTITVNPRTAVSALLVPVH